MRSTGPIYMLQGDGMWGAGTLGEEREITVSLGLCVAHWLLNSALCCAWCGEQSYECASGRQASSDVLKEAEECPRANFGRLRHRRVKIYGHENHMIFWLNGNLYSQSKAYLGELICLSLLEKLDLRAVPCRCHLDVPQDQQQHSWEIKGKEERLDQLGKERFLANEQWQNLAEGC